jgi:3-dehydroquinate synthase
MLDTPSNTISDVRVQSFNIAYEYPVVFTRDAFSSGNEFRARLPQRNRR